MYGDKTNLKHEMFDYTGNNLGHQNSNKRFREKLGSLTRRTFSRFTVPEHDIKYGKYCTAKHDACAIGMTAG